MIFMWPYLVPYIWMQSFSMLVDPAYYPSPPSKTVVPFKKPKRRK